MYFGLALLVIAQVSLKMNWFELLKPGAEYFHQFCIAQAPHSEWKSFYLAIVCAEPLPESGFKHALKLSSLLHMIVVSGTHLIVLEQILKKISEFAPKIRALIPFVILGFVFITLLSPPAIRALMHYFITKTNTNKKLFLRPVQLSWLSTLLVLAVFPEWIYSLSLLLSTAASLGVSLIFNSHVSLIKKHTLIYLFMALFLLPIGIPHPLSILFNVVLVPVFGGILFPLSLICFFIPCLTFITDFLWDVLSRFLQTLTMGLAPLYQSEVNLGILWIGLFFLQFYLALYPQNTNRNLVKYD